MAGGEIGRARGARLARAHDRRRVRRRFSERGAREIWGERMADGALRADGARRLGEASRSRRAEATIRADTEG